MIYYDRQGNPLSEEDGKNIWDVTSDERRVAETTVGDVWISTVFLGIDHNWGVGRPLLFETMAFPIVNGVTQMGNELYMNRYSTEEEAQAGHDFVVKEFTEGRLP